MSFVEATRQNIKPVASLQYTPGQDVSYDLSRVGFLARIGIRFKGTLTATHATKTTFTKASEAPWCLAKRLRLTLNNGLDVWNTSGYGAYLQNLINKINYRLDEIIAGSSVFQFGNTASSTGAANDIAFNLNMNIALNDRDAIGLLLLQSGQVVATVSIENNNPTSLMTDTDVTCSLTGNWYLTVEYFEIPKDTASWPVLNNVHQVLEDTNSIHAVGENRFTVQRGNTYLRIVNAIQINGSYADTGIERLGIRYNVANEPYSIPKDDMKAMQLMRYGRPLPTGVYVWDFYYQGVPNLGIHRDFIFSGNVSELDQYIQIASGTTLGSNNNTVKTIRDMLVAVQTN